jgi:hypothetical protein
MAFLHRQLFHFFDSFVTSLACTLSQGDAKNSPPFRKIAMKYTYEGFHKWGYAIMVGLYWKILLKYPNSWLDGLFHGKSQSKMDDT